MYICNEIIDSFLLQGDLQCVSNGRISLVDELQYLVRHKQRYRRSFVSYRTVKWIWIRIKTSFSNNGL